MDLLATFSKLKICLEFLTISSAIVSSFIHTSNTHGPLEDRNALNKKDSKCLLFSKHSTAIHSLQLLCA